MLRVTAKVKDPPLPEPESVQMAWMLPTAVELPMGTDGIEPAIAVQVMGAGDGCDTTMVWEATLTMPALGLLEGFAVAVQVKNPVPEPLPETTSQL